MYIHLGHGCCKRLSVMFTFDVCCSTVHFNNSKHHRQSLAAPVISVYTSTYT